MDKQLEIRNAKLEDYETVLDTLVATAKWLNEKGSSQWGDLLSGNDVHNTKRAIEKNEVYLASQEGILVGLFVLWDKQSEWDQALWGKDESDHHFYLHRITLTRQKHGKDMGIKLINAALNIARNHQKQSVRLDCIADNRYLNQFYQRAGFKLVSSNKRVNESNENSYNLYKIVFN